MLYNTYWVRFNHKRFTHRQAVENTKVLFDAASRAGVRRVVHISITNPSLRSPLEYFRGKAQLEAMLKDSRMSHAILRPTVLFGREDILINNIAWMLRHLPVFGIFGNGSYRLQPIFVDDLAELAVQHGAGTKDVTIDAIGPETFTYRELVEKIGEIIGCRKRLVSVSDRVGYRAALAMGRLLDDVVITRDEISGLMAELLYVDSPPTGHTRLTEWASEHGIELGRRYASELARRKAPHGG